MRLYAVRAKLTGHDMEFTVDWRHKLTPDTLNLLASVNANLLWHGAYIVDCGEVAERVASSARGGQQTE